MWLEIRKNIWEPKKMTYLFFFSDLNILGYRGSKFAKKMKRWLFWSLTLFRYSWSQMTKTYAAPAHTIFDFNLNFKSTYAIGDYSVRFIRISSHYCSSLSNHKLDDGQNLIISSLHWEFGTNLCNIKSCSEWYENISSISKFCNIFDDLDNDQNLTISFLMNQKGSLINSVYWNALLKNWAQN